MACRTVGRARRLPASMRRPCGKPGVSGRRVPAHVRRVTGIGAGRPRGPVPAPRVRDRTRGRGAATGLGRCPVRRTMLRGGTRSARAVQRSDLGRACAPTCSTPASCWPTRMRVAAVRRARGGAPGRGHHRAGGQARTTPSWATSRARRCGCSTTCGSSTAGSTSRCRSATPAAPLRVELNHTDPSVLPAGFRARATTTRRILAVARNLADEGATSRWSRKDLPMRVKASRGRACTPRSTAPSWPSSPAGPAWPRSRSPAGDLDELYDDERRRPRGGPRPALPHRARAASPSAAARSGRVTPDKQVRLVRGDRDAFGLHGRSAEQRVALDLLLDPDVGIVSLGGRAGTGKSALALCAGLEAVHGAPPAPQGRRLPAAVRRRRPGPRLPAGQRGREDVPRGPRRCSTPSAR